MKSIRSAALCALVAFGPAAVAEEPLTLYHGYTVPAPGRWGDVAVDLVPGAWHVGAPDGPPATESQLRSVLAHLEWLTIGGRCASTVEGPTSYPCNFGLRGLELGGVVDLLFESRPGGEPPVVWSMSDGDGLEAGGGPVEPPGGQALPASPGSGLVERFVGFVAPLRYLGDQLAAYGKQLRFGIRAAPNRLAQSRFDAASGLVILRRAAVPAVGQPA